MNCELLVAYDIPQSGKYQHDLLLKEIAGPDAKEMS